MQLRWNTNKGALTSEDLWQLSLNDLDTMAQGVNEDLRKEGKESFLPPTTNKPAKPATHNDLRLDILKHIIGVKFQEQTERQSRAQTLAKIARLKELAANKEDEQFAAKSLDEINKEIAELSALV